MQVIDWTDLADLDASRRCRYFSRYFGASVSSSCMLALRPSLLFYLLCFVSLSLSLSLCACLSLAQQKPQRCKRKAALLTLSPADEVAMADHDDRQQSPPGKPSLCDDEQMRMERFGK